MDRTHPSVLVDFPARPLWERVADRLAAITLLPAVTALGVLSGYAWLGLLK